MQEVQWLDVSHGCGEVDGVRYLDVSPGQLCRDLGRQHYEVRPADGSLSTTSRIDRLLGLPQFAHDGLQESILRPVQLLTGQLGTPYLRTVQCST
jgi:hypothetical protein